MTNPPRAKGTKAESAAARWLTGELGIEITRGPLRGNQDRGDLFGVPDTCVEVKNCKTPTVNAWAKELFAEMGYAGSNFGVILWSPPGVGMNSVDQWVALTPLWLGDRIVPLYGPVNRLHKFVSHMAAIGTAVSVGYLKAMPAHAWLFDLRERIAAA